MQLTGKEMNSAQVRQVSKLLHSISDFERLGDHAVNISKVAEELHEKKSNFSKEAQDELAVLKGAVKEIVSITTDAFYEDNAQLAMRVEPLREIIGILCDELKIRHIERLQAGLCDMKKGFAFNDLLNNLERIADHCSNVAVAVIEVVTHNFDTHEYLKNARESKNLTYRTWFEEYEVRYNINGHKKEKHK
jgi:phosphate:Na+ symporter